MPTRDGYPEGVPSWVDLTTTDVETAKRFYTALFGWEYEESPEATIPYWTAIRKGRRAAGIGPAQGAERYSMWSTYFAVDDAEVVAARVKDAGGRVLLEPMDILDSGRMAIAADPTGAIFGIWQANEHIGAGIVNEHGALNWNELTSDDLETALVFYENVFGHSHETTEGLTGRPYTSISAAGRVVAGAMAPPAEDIPNNWGVYFAVDDAQQTLDTALAHGGQQVYGPIEAESVGILVGLADPTGAYFTVIQLAQPVD